MNFFKALYFWTFLSQNLVPGHYFSALVTSCKKWSCIRSSKYLSYDWWFGMAAAAHISSKFSGLCPALLCWDMETNVEQMLFAHTRRRLHTNNLNSANHSKLPLRIPTWDQMLKQYRWTICKLAWYCPWYWYWVLQNSAPACYMPQVLCRDKLIL